MNMPPSPGPRPGEEPVQPTVLLVDDSADNLALMVELLRPIYKVKVANGGAKALKVAQSAAPPQLVLLDIMMPDMDGYEVCRRLQADPATRGIPVIFLTAMNESEDEARGLALGAVDYITKPINPPILLARVRNHLALKALRDLDAQRMEMLEREKRSLEEEQRKTDRLMLSIFPEAIVERLKAGESNISGSHPQVSVLFADLAGFTGFAATLSAPEVVRLLNDLFSRFDHRVGALGIEKIKTIGDAYMAAAGVPLPMDDHAQRCAEAALGMLRDMEAFNAEHGTQLALRVGLHCGPVIAGVIGTRKFAYDLWGNTVNVASRMEALAREDSIRVTPAFREALGDRYRFEAHPPEEVRGVGPMATYTLLG